MCQVWPDKVALLTAFGGPCLAGGVASVLTGQSCFRGRVARDEDPFGFWSAASGLLGLGALCFYGLAFCPRG